MASFNNRPTRVLNRRPFASAHQSKPFDSSQGRPTFRAPSINREAARPMDISDLVGGPASAQGYGEAKPASGQDYGGVRPASEPTPPSPMNEFNSESNGNNGSYGGYGGPRDLQDSNIQTLELSGVLEIMPEGHGYLRPKFVPSDRDVYISSSQIRRFNLRLGDMVTGVGRAPKDTERYYGLLRVDKVNGEEAEKALTRPYFDDLVPIYPDKQLTLETGPIPLSTRIIDLIAPIGRGQRGMIVSPPRAGKTWLLKEIANGISTNYPDYHLMITLVGERPEEVTDLTRSTKAEVVASNFDQSPAEQVRVAEVSLDRAKRLVELGKNVVILLDSITRLARAYNMAIVPSGRTLSGGFDPAAIYPSKQFLGAARCFEEGGGSLTIIGTALVSTDSRMDDLIYEEFKGTGNMELHLDRRMAERRIYPAIDVGMSGTRNFERFLTPEKLKKIDTLVKMLHMLNDTERTEMLIERLSKTKDNNEFLDSLSQGA